MTQKIRTVLVDDDEDYLESVVELLEGDAFEISAFTSLHQMNAERGTLDPDILILDVILPDESTFDLLPILRKETGCGLILVSGNRNIEARIEGLEKGADVYLTKPIDIRELKAMIKSLYQRLTETQAIDMAQPRNDTQASFPSKLPGDIIGTLGVSTNGSNAVTEYDSTKEKEIWLLNYRHHKLSSPDGNQQKLTNSEFTVLNLLISANGCSVTKDLLMTALGKTPSFLEEGSLHTTLSRLRAKFKAKGIILPIRSVRNVGYCFYEKAKVINPK